MSHNSTTGDPRGPSHTWGDAAPANTTGNGDPRGPSHTWGDAAPANTTGNGDPRGPSHTWGDAAPANTTGNGSGSGTGNGGSSSGGSGGSSSNGGSSNVDRRTKEEKDAAFYAAATRALNAAANGDDKPLRDFDSFFGISRPEEEYSRHFYADLSGTGLSEATQKEIKDWFIAKDTDNDGVVNSGEIDSQAATLAADYLGSDISLSMSEAVQYHKDRATGIDQMLASSGLSDELNQEIKDWFLAHDTNHDGVATSAEMPSGTMEVVKNYIGADGKMSVREAINYHRAQAGMSPLPTEDTEIGIVIDTGTPPPPPPPAEVTPQPTETTPGGETAPVDDGENGGETQTPEDETNDTYGVVLSKDLNEFGYKVSDVHITSQSDNGDNYVATVSVPGGGHIDVARQIDSNGETDHFFLNGVRYSTLDEAVHAHAGAAQQESDSQDSDTGTGVPASGDSSDSDSDGEGEGTQDPGDVIEPNNAESANTPNDMAPEEASDVTETNEDGRPVGAEGTGSNESELGSNDGSSDDEDPLTKSGSDQNHTDEDVESSSALAGRRAADEERLKKIMKQREKWGGASSGSGADSLAAPVVTPASNSQGFGGIPGGR